MYQLTGAELKVLLYICRRTFGFKQNEADISLNQLINGTRLSRDSVTRVARGLESKGVIVRTSRQSPEKGNEPNDVCPKLSGRTYPRIGLGDI